MACCLTAPSHYLTKCRPEIISIHPAAIRENVQILSFDIKSWKSFMHLSSDNRLLHDDVIKWKHFPCCWPFVRGIHRWTVNSPRKGQLRGALMFSLICVRTNGWVNNRDAGDFRRHRAHYDVTVNALLTAKRYRWIKKIPALTRATICLKTFSSQQHYL